MNHFQPSFQLLERSRDGGSVKKRYGIPATPCDRLLWRNDVSEEVKVTLRDSQTLPPPFTACLAWRRCRYLANRNLT